MNRSNKTYGLLIGCWVSLLMPFTGMSQNVRKELKEGNTQYESGKFQEAETHYRKALEGDAKSYGGQYNLGNAIYKQDRAAEAEKQYREAGQVATTSEQKSKNLHNLGNALMK